MEQFLAVAAAHFLALLIPGVDFFLIARTAMTNGWRSATGVCLGIATANGIFIAAAFSGVSLISHPLLLSAIQLAGGGFLIFIGIAFLRSRARIGLEQAPNAKRTTWLRNFGLGIASGLLNPKNALFYVSLAAAVGNAPPMTLTLYGHGCSPSCWPGMYSSPQCSAPAVRSHAWNDSYRGLPGPQELSSSSSAEA